MREPVAYVPPFDYRAFPIEEIRAALLHMRDLGQALYDLRHLVEQLPAGADRTRITAILDEASDFQDDYLEISFAHLEDEAGLLRHVDKLGPLTDDQQARLEDFRHDFERRIEPLRVQAEALQDQWQRARRAYFDL